MQCVISRNEQCGSIRMLKIKNTSRYAKVHLTSVLVIHLDGNRFVMVYQIPHDLIFEAAVRFPHVIWSVCYFYCLYLVVPQWQVKHSPISNVECIEKHLMCLFLINWTLSNTWMLLTNFSSLIVVLIFFTYCRNVLMFEPHGICPLVNASISNHRHLAQCDKLLHSD